MSTNHSLQHYTVQGGRIDAVLVLRIENGNDAFFGLRGTYAPSFFGLSLTTLAGLPRCGMLLVVVTTTLPACAHRSSGHDAVLMVMGLEFAVLCHIQYLSSSLEGIAVSCCKKGLASACACSKVLVST